MKKQIKKLGNFCRKPMITKGAIILSSFATAIALFSFDPVWYDQRPMPEALKKKLY